MLTSSRPSHGNAVLPLVAALVGILACDRDVPATRATASARPAPATSARPATAPSSKAPENVSDADLVGRTVARARAEIGLVLGESFVIHEPPGVPRGIYGTTASGQRLELYVQRGSLPVGKPKDWPLDRFDPQTVVGVARRVEGRWHVAGQVMVTRAMYAEPAP